MNAGANPGTNPGADSGTGSNARSGATPAPGSGPAPAPGSGPAPTSDPTPGPLPTPDPPSTPGPLPTPGPPPGPAPRRELRAGLPGWVLRAAITLTCAAVAGVLTAAGVEGPALVLYLLLAVVAAAIPASAAAILLVAYPAGALVFATDGTWWPGVLALVVLLHLVHVLCAYAALVPLRSRVHPEALRAPAKRFVLVQLPVLALAGLVTLLPAGRTDAPVEVIGLACALGLAAGAVLLLRRGR